MIDFEEGGKQKVALQRQDNNKMPFLVKLDSADADAEASEMPSGAGGMMDDDDDDYTAEELDELERRERLLSEEVRGGRDMGSEEDDDDLDADDESPSGRGMGSEEGELDGDETDEEDYPARPMPQRTRSEEWMGADDPGYVRIPVLDGLMPFGHEEEPEEQQNTITIPEGWETATSRSTGKTYFINTITGDSQYEFPVGPARMYASESDVSDMEDSYGAPAPAPAPSEAAPAPVLSEVRAEASPDQGISDEEAPAATPVVAAAVSDDAEAAAAAAAAPEAAAAAAPVADDAAAVAASAAAAELERGTTPAIPAEVAAVATEVAAEVVPVSVEAAPVVVAKEEEVVEEEHPLKKWECMPVKFYFEPGKTGFEASTEYAAVPDELIIGRYRIVKFLGEGAFSKAIQCIDTDGDCEAPVCMKIVKCGDRKDYFDQSLDEIKLLQYINGGHESMDAVHIFQMHDFFYHKEHLVSVTPLRLRLLFNTFRFCC